MKKRLLYLLLLSGSLFISCKNENCNVVKNDLRAPAYPLITIDPYTSAWSFGDKLYDTQVKHWTGKNFPLLGVIRVDGQSYRFMGTEEPQLLFLVKTAEQGAWSGKYTFDKPKKGWEQTGFNDRKWKEAPAAFGTIPNEPFAKTQWNTSDIWVRRTFVLENDLEASTVYLEYSHDDDAEIYINGIEVVNTGNKASKNNLLKLNDEVKKTLKKGENLISAHCKDRGGLAFIDFGLCLEQPSNRNFIQTAEQKSSDVQATRTIYEFACGNIDLKLTFTAPLLLDNLDLIARPVNYISYEVQANDSKEHAVELYLEAGPNWALNGLYQESISEVLHQDGLVYLKTGSKDQNILGTKGDDVRIDWGYCYIAADQENTQANTGESFHMRNNFAKEGNIDRETPRALNGQNQLALSRSLGNVKDKTQGYFMLGYDDLYSIEYFGEKLRPYWNRTGTETIFTQFNKAREEYDTLIKSCCAFDRAMQQDAINAGGKKYAELCALAYRQAIAAHKLTQAPNGDLLFFSKENYSNGSIGTVDITYPSAPLFLLYNTELAKGLMNHIFYYSESGKWPKPFAAHDVGTYPIANGQTYGGDMPVEESGNMLILTAALAAREGNAQYAEKHWQTLSIWADYLVENGLDPENQLCTDDFAGHFAHNTNLSIKAILAIASYGYLADMLGKDELAQSYLSKAKGMAQEWLKMADDGDHYRLTFDKPGTWSQKYNLVWDKLLRLNIFPDEVAEKELAYYLTQQNKYGLPLDSRSTYTKADWIIWTATLADDQATFEALIDPLYLFMNETTERIPMSDWFYTDKPLHTGFQARSVVGGYFIKMLEKELQK